MRIYEKKSITVRLVDTDTGVIYNEVRHTYDFRKVYRKDKQFLHAFLDDFIERIYNPDKIQSVCLEFVNNLAVPEPQLPF